ncbi:hypothetical protein CY35_18G094100, partial [Sphagnum magellanicum]
MSNLKPQICSSKKSLTTWTFEGPPFRTDNYTQHLRLNHKTRWEEYQRLAHQDKSKYFDVAVKHAETICHYIEPQSEAITLTVSSSIVDVITKSKQFLLVTRYVGCGMSFAMVADAIHDAKEVCDIPKLGACNDYLVASYARVACALSIEHISQVLCSKWAFSVAFDTSTDLQQTSWVDVRIRLATFGMFEKLFDAIYPLWKDKLIGCSTDGVANMTRRHSGVVTRIQNVMKPNFMRKVYKRVGCNFYKTFTSIISFLRRQKNLVEEMQAICPNFSATRWASMSRFARFLVEKRSKIILISVISEISTHVSECVESLQGRWVTLQQQTATIQSLLDFLQHFAFVELTLDDDTLPAVQDVVNSIDLIVDQHKKLLNVVNKEPRLQTALARHSEQIDFSDAWKTPSIKDQFPELMEFCGGLASPFPNTATVESDFS